MITASIPWVLLTICKPQNCHPKCWDSHLCPWDEEEALSALSMSQVSDVGQGRKIGSPGLCDAVMFPVWEASGGGRVVTSLGRRKQFNKKKYLSWKWSAWIWDQWGDCISSILSKRKPFSINPVWGRNPTALLDWEMMIQAKRVSTLHKNAVRESPLEESIYIVLL